MTLHAHGYTEEAHACYVEAQILAPEVSNGLTCEPNVRAFWERMT